MSDERAGENEPVYLTLEDVLELYGLIVGPPLQRQPTTSATADWIVSFSAGATPEDIAKVLRSALHSFE